MSQTDDFVSLALENLYSSPVLCDLSYRKKIQVFSIKMVIKIYILACVVKKIKTRLKFFSLRKTIL